MAVNPIDSQGTVLTLDGVTIGGTKSVSGLGSGSPTERDRSTLEDREFRRFGVGLRDGGSLTVTLLVDTSDPGQRKAYYYWRKGKRAEFQLQLVNGTTRAFMGYVFGFPENFEADADVMATMTIRVDGDIAGFPDP